jgi:hypothetical protein
MRGNVKYTFFVIIILCLCGCTTLETYIENSEYYNILPIEQKRTFLFGEEFRLENYKLVYKRDDSQLKEYFLYDEETITKKYIFYNDNFQICKIEIVKWEQRVNLSQNTTLYTGIKRYIRIIYNNGTEIKYPINQEQRTPYIIFEDNVKETVNINYYYSKNRKNPDQDWTYHTGFDISVNNEEYGIITFYPRSLYLKKNQNIQDRMALYILATYVSYVYQ